MAEVVYVLLFGDVCGVRCVLSLCGQLWCVGCDRVLCCVSSCAVLLLLLFVACCWTAAMVLLGN